MRAVAELMRQSLATDDERAARGARRCAVASPGGSEREPLGRSTRSEFVQSGRLMLDLGRVSEVL
jgi:hypothetical protein